MSEWVCGELSTAGNPPPPPNSINHKMQKQGAPPSPRASAHTPAVFDDRVGALANNHSCLLVTRDIAVRKQPLSAIAAEQDPRVLTVVDPFRRCGVGAKGARASCKRTGGVLAANGKTAQLPKGTRIDLSKGAVSAEEDGHRDMRTPRKTQSGRRRGGRPSSVRHSRCRRNLTQRNGFHACMHDHKRTHRGAGLVL